MASEILWDESAFKVEPMRSPYAVLAEQAKVVEKLSGGRLCARLVAFRRRQPSPMFRIVLYLGAPALPKFDYEILAVSYAETMPYPCFVDAQEVTDFHGESQEVATESALKDVIRTVLKSSRVVGAISSLQVRVNELESGSDAPEEVEEEVELPEIDYGDLSNQKGSEVPF